MPAVLAFSGQVITGLVEFSGPVRSRLVACLVLACAGAASVVLGTWCSRDVRPAAGTMAGRVRDLVLRGQQRLHRGGPAAMLTFIFAVTIPAPFSAVPAQLAGWAFAAAVAIGAQLLWPSRPDTALRGDAAQACLALADLVEVTSARDQQPTPGRTQAARTAVCALRRRFHHV
jgi:hypothetical protein